MIEIMVLAICCQSPLCFGGAVMTGLCQNRRLLPALYPPFSYCCFRPFLNLTVILLNVVSSTMPCPYIRSYTLSLKFTCSPSRFGILFDTFIYGFLNRFY